MWNFFNKPIKKDIKMIEYIEDQNELKFIIRIHKESIDQLKIQIKEHEGQFQFLRNRIDQLIDKLSDNEKNIDAKEGPFLVDEDQHEANLQKLVDNVNKYVLNPEFLKVLNELPEIDPDGSIMRVVEGRDIITGKSRAELEIEWIEASKILSDESKKEIIQQIKYSDEAEKSRRLHTIKHERPHVSINGKLQEDIRPGADLMWRYYDAVNNATVGSEEDQQRVADLITSGIDKIKKEKNLAEAIKNHNEKVANEAMNLSRAAARKQGINPDILIELDPVERFFDEILNENK